MLEFCQSPFLRMNLDTGNSFIAGQEPVAFAERFKDKVAHVHVKDVSQSLAAAARGGQTGIAVSHCAIGEGVNAANIVRVLEILRDHGYDGVLSMECEGQGGPLIEKSLHWLRMTLERLAHSGSEVMNGHGHSRRHFLKLAGLGASAVALGLRTPTTNSPLSRWAVSRATHSRRISTCSSWNRWEPRTAR